MVQWISKKIVVKDFRISFKPLSSDTAKKIDLSGAVADQSIDEAIYVAVTGRPAGLLNFIREHIGLSRRFEFLLTSTQCIQRLGSPSTQILSVAQLAGLNTITVGLIRPLKASIIWSLTAILMVLAATHSSSPPSMPEPEVASAEQSSDEAIGADVKDADAQIAAAAEAENLQESPTPPSVWNSVKLLLFVVGSVMVAIAPVWIWVIAAVALGIYAAYLFFIAKLNLVTATEGGEPVVGFIVSPSFLESRSTDIPLSELNKIPMIFHVLKAK